MKDRAREIAESWTDSDHDEESTDELTLAIRAYGDERANEVLACHDCREFRAHLRGTSAPSSS